MTILRILAALLCLTILVTIHEFGHFIVAKSCGVKVNEFAIGMGPKLVTKKSKKTGRYAMRIPPELCLLLIFVQLEIKSLYQIIKLNKVD